MPAAFIKIASFVLATAEKAPDIEKDLVPSIS
jgi:hypothetical protein